MKTILVTCTLGLGLSSAAVFARTVTADGVSKVSDSPALMGLFGVLSDVAKDGQPVEFFGWTEEEAVPTPVADCKSVERHDAEDYLTSLVSKMDWATYAESIHISTHLVPALGDLRTLLGTDQLERCDWTIQPEDQLIKFTRFRNTATGYDIAFTQGFQAS